MRLVLLSPCLAALKKKVGCFLFFFFCCKSHRLSIWLVVGGQTEPASVTWAGVSYEEREEAGEAGYLELAGEPAV